MRWEFYVQVSLMTLSGNVVNSTFRVLFSEMMPPRNEARWFGLLYVLSCATVSSIPAVILLDVPGESPSEIEISISVLTCCKQVWINYVASAPLQNATHQLRFPLVLSLVFTIIAFVLEFVRVTVPFFKHDQERWAAHDKTILLEETRDQSIASEEAPVGTFAVQQIDGLLLAKG